MEEDIENYLLNNDNTYTCLAGVECKQCGLRWNHQLECLWWQDYRVLKEFSQRVTPQFDSQIEVIFWETWKKATTIPLLPQYWIGKYRVDFAHISTKTIIELDGRRYHSTPYQIANDERRQADIEQKGWRFIRFMAEDIYTDIRDCIVETLQFLSR